MEDNETKKTEVEADGLGLIDVASEDDSLLFSSFPDPTSYEFSGELQYLFFDFGFMGSGFLLICLITRGF